MMGFSPCAILPSQRRLFLAACLAFVAMEELILFAAAALGALQAAHKQHRHAHRDQHGKNASIRRKPMRYSLHVWSPFRSIRSFVEV
jgi:hypothetical protein